MKNKIEIQFLGAAGTVTGSKILVQTQDKKFLVDCGLFQGLKELRLLNWNPLPVDASTIDFVILTHGHLDHTGYLPRLVKEGFSGKIFGTPPTLDIAEIILKDSARIQEEEAEQANREGYSKHSPAKPLYDLQDAEETTKHFTPVNTDEWIDFGSHIKIRYQTNGHIIGSTFIEVEINGKILVFSGDVGQKNDLLLLPPQRPHEADFLFVESTYGDRLHQHENIQERLKKIITETFNRSGLVIIPSFAVERTQLMMLMIWRLMKSNSIPKIPMIIDSPMGAKVLDVFHTYKNWHKIPMAEYSEMCDHFKIVESFRETQSIIASKSPKIVIAGSGMISGGRVLSYLQTYIEKPETTVLIVGYQGEGTRGRQLLEGAHEIKIYGKYYQVNAQIEVIHGLSAHGDQSDLLGWMSEIKNKPQQVFIIHGEKQSSDTFRVKISDHFGWNATIPALFDKIEIEI